MINRSSRFSFIVRVVCAITGPAGALSFVLVCLFMGLPATPAYGQSEKTTDPDSSRVTTLLAEGDTHYHRFDNRQALDAYFKAYDLASTSFEVLTRLARTTTDYGLDLYADNLHKEAERSFYQAQEYALKLEQLYPDNGLTYLHLARVGKNLASFRAGRDKIQLGRDIESYCLRGMQLAPKNARLRVIYASLNREMADMNWVERTFSEALFGELPRGSLENALSLLDEAISLQPDLHLAHYEMALTYISLGLPDEAMPFLENSVSLPAQTSQDNRNRQLASRMIERLKK